MRYDVIVVGAGPSGSTAARESAALGLSVLMLDRAEFPRDKPCGGGVNVRTVRLLPFDLEPVVERSIGAMRVDVKLRHGYVRRSGEALSYMTQRRNLDALLVTQACRSGVIFKERLPLRAVERSKDRVVVRAGRETFEARALVAADGANGSAAKLAGLSIHRDLGIALEGNINPDAEYPSEWEDAFGLELGTCPGGYGWIFPKDDHVNIGVGGRSPTGPRLRRLLERLTRFYGFDPAEMWGIRGHPLPVRRPGSPLARGNVLAVGDAAGFVDVLTGEGIYAAVCSGQLAARHLARYLGGRSPDLRGYEIDADRQLDAELRVSRQLYDILHLSPALAAALVRRSPRAWRLACNLLTGNTTYTSLKEPVWLAAGIDAASALSRVLHPQDSLSGPRIGAWSGA